MKSASICILSAFLGAVLAIWISTPSTEQAVAQEGNRQQRNGRRGPRFPFSYPDDTGKRNDEEKKDEETLKALPKVYNQQGLSSEEAVNVAIYDRVNKSVVNITTKGGNAFLLLEITTEGAGSGAVINKKGHILTNYHVVENSKNIEVNLFNGKSYPAKIIGAEPASDMAIIKIDAPAEFLYPIQFGDSSSLKVGMRVFAIGNPFGLERTMTTGIISSLNRSLQIKNNRSIKSVIQIDAAVNPGNSGGPLIDSHGRVIGINTAIASKNGQSAGIGFAIPINLALRIVPQLIKSGRFVRPETGIGRVFETEKGLMIATVTPNGPADRAGLRGPQKRQVRRGIFVVEKVDRNSADIIVGIDGEKVKTADDFLGYIEKKRVGDRVVLDILRNGRKTHISIVLGNPKSSHE
ncbi:Outer membrane stress sensor protease DegQ, serine protease [hydrothermal vent metagenome]|uniref:Outer membrane stress sensor protease DegQ, serine protease n=1 Tax=hydrothermal vent metagenome TaxID=652676 RepID=A0A3B1DBS9_9ZZZZ